MFLFFTALFARELDAPNKDPKLEGLWPWGEETAPPTPSPVTYTGKAYKKPIIFVNGLTESVLQTGEGFTFPIYCVGVDHTQPIWPPQVVPGAECILEALTLCASNDDRILESCYHDKPLNITVPEGAAGTIGGSSLAEAMYAAFGYEEGKTMRFFTYDWRFAGLAPYMHADFARLKDMIKEMHDTYGEKVHLLSISLGGPFTNHFFNWVDTQDADFLEDNVVSHIAVSAAYMGSSQPLKSWITPITRFYEANDAHDSWSKSNFYRLLSYLNLDGIDVIRSMPAAVYLAPWPNSIKDGWEDRVLIHDNKTNTDYRATIDDYKKLIAVMKAGKSGPPNSLDLMDLFLDPVLDTLLEEGVPVNPKLPTLCLGVETQKMAIGYVFDDVTSPTSEYDAIWGKGDEVVPDFGLQYCASNADERTVTKFSFDMDESIEGHVGIIGDERMWAKVKEHLDSYEDTFLFSGHGHRVE